jgi:hypothetical protein
VLGEEQNFRRFVCENMDNIESEAGARFWVLAIMSVIQAILLGLLLWRVW